MTALLDRADAQLGVLDELAQDDGGERFGAKLAAGDGPAEASDAPCAA